MNKIETKRKNIADIICIGAQKSGTTWLASILRNRDDIWIPSSHAVAGKEIHFFDHPKRWARGIEWYRDIMMPPRGHMSSIDITPAYAKLGHPKIRVCNEVSPSARVFFIVRNPVERDWSSLKMEARRLNIDLGNMSDIDILVLYDELRIGRFDNYPEAIERWQFYYADAFRVFNYDDLSKNPFQFYKDVCVHCRLDADKFPLSEEILNRKVFVGEDIEMPNRVREFLTKKHKKMIERLSTVIDFDIGAWR